LTGEAYFDVRKGKKFTVEFPGAKVKVIGTKFNVLAYSDQFFSVNCTEGQVQLVFKKNVVAIQAGQGVKFFDDKVVGPFAIKTHLIKERLKGIYFWDKISIDELFYLIGCHFGYQIEVDSAIADRNFSGKVDFVNLQNGLSIIAYAMDLSYQINKETQTIIVDAK
jgi:ferric-dicitrate binding protein FerR (iron transport regulator)